jgi:tRNA (guanine-N7-)-methyltransferase
MKRFFLLSEEIPPENREEQTSYFGRIFGNLNPLVVEIGSGNGHFLVAYAREHPGRNFIGTEILGGRARKFSHKLEKRGMRNVVVFKGDARQFVWEYLYEDSVVEFVIMFPDPWPKKRHHKHRILRASFIEMLNHRLIPNGRIWITTDVAAYRDFIIEEFDRVGGFRNLNRRDYTRYPDRLPKSLFEDRFRRENRELYFLRYAKE